MITSQPFGMRVPPDFGGNKNFNPQIKRPYSASGVHFAGSIQGNGPTYLVNSNLQTVNTQSGAFSGGDNGRFSFSFWAQNLMNPNNNSCTLWVTDPGVVGMSGAYTPFVSTTGLASTSTFQFSAANGNSTISPSWAITPARFPPTDSNWHHYLGSIYTNRAQGSKIAVLYVDDILLNPISLGDTGGAFFAPIAGRKFYFGDDFINLNQNPPPVSGFGPDMNVADVWIAPGYSLLDIDITNSREILASRISADDRRVFTSILGGNIMIPNDPQTFPSAAILFTGGAGGFGANLGFGGAFALVGTLSTVPGPSQIPV